MLTVYGHCTGVAEVVPTYESPAYNEARLYFPVPRQQIAFSRGETIIGWQRLPTAIGVPQAQDAAISAVSASETLLGISEEIAASCGLRPPRCLRHRGHPKHFTNRTLTG